MLGIVWFSSIRVIKKDKGQRILYIFIGLISLIGFIGEAQGKGKKCR